ncbi:MAG TPA: hypothetical protein VNM47_18625 [Terriglobia bacterium]|nr:hypothetical protein [Terriglobia bacterium]
MAAQVLVKFDFGGVDSRSNPIGFPPGRSLRCRNWVKDRSGALKLRHGYSAPTMSSTDTSSAIHSAFLFERYDNSRYVMYGQGTALKSMQIGSAGTVSTVGTLSTSSQFNCFLADNYLFIGNGTDFKFYDSTTLRNVGIRAPLASEGEALRDDFVVLSGGETTISITLSSLPVITGSVQVWQWVWHVGGWYTEQQIGSDDGAGGITGTGISTGSINYTTGALSITFSPALPKGYIFIWYDVPGISAAESTASAGSWSATTLSGYQFYMSYYNPTTQDVGNRLAFGDRVQVSGTQSVIVITNLPDISSVDSEWVKLIGRTADGGEVPYALIDPGGNWITVGGTVSTATFTIPDADYNSELPTRNDVPPAFSKMCFAGHRGYAIDPSDPHKIRFSESENDALSAYYVGLPYCAWPADNALLFPTGEGCMAIHEYRGDCWVWTSKHIGIISESGNFSPNGLPYPNWAGVYIGGIAGQRAFINTAHGPFWLSDKKQLLTMTQEGPAVASAEYEAGLLTRISDDNLSAAEVSYFRDTSKGIDRLYVLGKDSSNAPVIIVHDFQHKSSQSPYGEGLEYSYAGMTASTFVRNPQSVISMVDENGAERIRVGDSAGAFDQLEDGLTDNGNTYSADYIGLLNLGPSRPQIGGVRWHGDGNLKISHANVLNWTLAQFSTAPTEAVQDTEEDEFLFRADLETNGKFLVWRLQLDSHATGSDTLDLNDPPHLPLEDYGRVYVLEPEIGAGRYEGVRP